MSKTAVLLLAAGSASRMGRPKQMLKWKNTTILGNAIHNASQLKVEKTVVVLGAHYETIISNIKNGNNIIIRNDAWEQGLGNSIALGVRYIHESFIEIENILIMLADQPLIDFNFLKHMIERHILNEKQIVCTAYENNRLGVPAIFNKIYFKELMQLNTDKGARDILKKYFEELTFINGGDLIQDIDTIDDYNTIYSEHH